MPALATPRGITPRILDIARLYVDGHSTQDVANQYGISNETVRSHINTLRRQLRAEGYRNTHNIIGLRRALRHRGNLDELPPI